MKSLSLIKLFSTFLLLGFALVSCNEDLTTEISTDLQGDDLIETRNSSAGKVYTMSNDADDNQVIAFDRAADGTLSNPAYYSTGGTGNGGGLGSQEAIVLDRRFLFVSNAGSNEISVFRTNGGGLTLVDVEPSGGQMPVSITVRRNIVYVLNAGGAGNIAGFTFNSQGQLSPIAGSVQPLSSSTAGGAQVSFNQSGRLLVVTEKATNAISIYGITESGVAGPPTTYPSAGQTPFGFDFGKRGEVIVSEAFGGAPGASALSSYRLNNDGSLELITGPVATNQTAACWVKVTGNKRYAYTTNTGSGSVSGFSISNSGGLEILDPDGVTGTSGAGPIDMSMSRNSAFLYTLNAADDSITMFEVGNDGSLTSMGEVSGLPVSVVGLAAE